MAARLRRLLPDLRDADVEAADSDVGVALPANKSGVGLRMKLDYEKQERPLNKKGLRAWNAEAERESRIATSRAARGTTTVLPENRRIQEPGLQCYLTHKSKFLNLSVFDAFSVTKYFCSPTSRNHNVQQLIVTGDTYAQFGDENPPSIGAPIRAMEAKRSPPGRAEQESPSDPR
jgi:hypothetical protein